MYSQIIFCIVSAFITFFAFLTLKFENIFYSLLSAMAVFLGTAVLFFIAGSEYNAIIQFAVYGFAVPVILGLAVMFTTMKEKNNVSKSAKGYVLLLICGIFILALIYLTMTSLLVIPDGFNETGVPNIGICSIRDFSKGIFVKYVWGFELLSVILTVAAAGLTLFKKEVNQ